MSLSLSTSAWKHGAAIPRRFTCEGEDLSPPLEFQGTPPGTESLALVCDDPDAPVGTWVHWVLYNIPPRTLGIGEGQGREAGRPKGALQGKNSWGRLGYGGPCPPPGQPHRYFFKLYALASALPDRPGMTAAELEHAMEGKVLARAEWMGTYRRR